MHLLPPLTSIVKSSLLTHAHSSPLCLAARLHWLCTNHSHYFNNGWTFFWQTSTSGCSILSYWSMFLFLCKYHTVLIFLQFCNIVWNRKCEAFSSVSFLKIGHLESFVFPYSLRLFFLYMWKKSLECWYGPVDCIVLGSMDITTILILPICEHRISFYLCVCVSSSISFINIL